LDYPLLIFILNNYKIILTTQELVFVYTENSKLDNYILKVGKLNLLRNILMLQIL